MLGDLLSVVLARFNGPSGDGCGRPFVEVNAEGVGPGPERGLLEDDIVLTGLIGTDLGTDMLMRTRSEGPDSGHGGSASYTGHDSESLKASLLKDRALVGQRAIRKEIILDEATGELLGRKGVYRRSPAVNRNLEGIY